MSQFYNNPLNNISNSNSNNDKKQEIKNNKSLEILHSVDKMDMNYNSLNENKQKKKDFNKELERENTGKGLKQESKNEKEHKLEFTQELKKKNENEKEHKQEQEQEQEQKQEQESIKNTLLNDLELNINKEETQQLIKNWLDLDDEIEKLNLAIKERKNKQKKLNEIITRLMVSKNIPKFNTSTSDIILTERKQKKTLSTGLLLNLSTNYFENNSSKAENFIKYIDENRGITIINNIKRKKKNMNKI